MNAESRTEAVRDHRLEKARRAGDRLAVAVLEGERTFTPEPDYPLFVVPRFVHVWAGLRWSAAA